MDFRSGMLQKPIYQAIFKIWGAKSSFINTGICISQALQYLIQSNVGSNFEHPRVHMGFSSQNCSNLLKTRHKKRRVRLTK